MHSLRQVKVEWLVLSTKRTLCYRCRQFVITFCCRVFHDVRFDDCDSVEIGFAAHIKAVLKFETVLMSESKSERICKHRFSCATKFKFSIVNCGQCGSPLHMNDTVGYHQ
eukprot:COSAG02_NODE_5241_length_4511_cov_47.251133_3_plen_110_part_00